MPGGGGQTVVRTETQEPWEQQRPYLIDTFKQAQDLYRSDTPKQYQGDTLAGFDPSQTAAHKGIIDYVGGPRTTAMQKGAEDALVNTMTGQVPTAQLAPVLKAMTTEALGNFNNQIMPSIRANQMSYQPGGSSRGDIVTGLAGGAMASQLANNAQKMYYNAFNQAQQNRINSMRMYPSIMSAPLQPMQALYGVGADRQRMSQAVMDNARARWDAEQNKSWNKLGQYANLVRGNFGGTSTSTSPAPQTNPLSVLMGLGSLFGSGGMFPGILGF